MKKSPPPKSQASAPAVLTSAATARLLRFATLLALIAPLVDTLLIFPLRQIILANLGAGVFFQIVFQVTELFNLVAFFLLLALAVYCAIAGSLRIVGRIVALHGISSIFVVVILRILLYWLMAWIDSGYFLPFDLSNQTLNTLTQNSGAELMSLALSLFISQVILFVLLAVVVFIAMRTRQKALAARADLSPIALCKSFDASPLPGLLRTGLILYTLFALINQIYDTVATVINLGAPDSFGSLMSLVVPYFLLAIYTLLCYLALDYGTRYIAQKATV